jgi:hypothetical protein
MALLNLDILFAALFFFLENFFPPCIFRMHVIELASGMLLIAALFPNRVMDFKVVVLELRGLPGRLG